MRKSKKKSSTSNTSKHESKKTKPAVNSGDTKSNRQRHEKGWPRCYGCGGRNHAEKNCPNKSDGPKCFKINKFRHISTNCSIEESKKVMAVQDETQNNEPAVLCNFTASKDVIKIVLNGFEVLALVDSGSDINIIANSRYQQIGRLNFEKKTLTFLAAGPQKINTIGRFTARLILIDGDLYDTVFHVVQDAILPIDVIVGKELMNQAITTFTPTDITMRKIQPNCLAGVVHDFELDCKHINDVRVANQLRSLVVSYNPVKKYVGNNVELKLILKDETPIAQRPRRLSPLEFKIVRQQVDEWLKEEIIQPSSSEYCIAQL